MIWISSRWRSAALFSFLHLSMWKHPPGLPRHCHAAGAFQGFCFLSRRAAAAPARTESKAPGSSSTGVLCLCRDTLDTYSSWFFFFFKAFWDHFEVMWEMMSWHFWLRCWFFCLPSVRWFSPCSLPLMHARSCLGRVASVAEGLSGAVKTIDTEVLGTRSVAWSDEACLFIAGKSRKKKTVGEVS